jgi:hypothetical protein
VITSSIDVGRPQAVVFAYLEQLDRHSEWQQALTSVWVEGAAL